MDEWLPPLIDCTAPITLLTLPAMSAPDGSMDDVNGEDEEEVEDDRVLIDCTTSITFDTPVTISLPDGSTEDSGDGTDEEAAEGLNGG